MLELNKVVTYLDMVKNVKSSFTFYDMHVHPFEIMQTSLGYNYEDVGKGIYSNSQAKFIPPTAHRIKLDKTFEVEKLKNQKMYEQMLEKINIILYRHVGPKVFGIHMDMSCIDKVLLLPVSPVRGDIDEQMISMEKIYGENDRFWKGGSIPNTINNTGMREWIKQMIDQYDIRAIKIHPNITGIDLGSSPGKERIENILIASNEFKLPLVFHGGRTGFLSSSGAATYASIENLSEINWGLTSEPVVIAHAATYGYRPREIEETVIPRMGNMLSRYNNIVVDISGIDFRSICTIINKIDINRILFGSDALYNLQWENVVILVHALNEYKLDIEECLIKIMSINPQKFVFRERIVAQ